MKIDINVSKLTNLKSIPIVTDVDFEKSGYASGKNGCSPIIECILYIAQFYPVFAELQTDDVRTNLFDSRNYILVTFFREVGCADNVNLL